MKIRINIFALFTFFISVVTILIVFWIEYIENIKPCQLCLYQRLPYYVLIPLSMIIIFIKSLKRVFFISIVISIILLISIFLATYHSGIEKNIWSNLAGCSNHTNIDSNNLDDLRKKILDIPLIRCDKVTWNIYLFSLTNLNLILSAALFIISLLINIKIYKKIRRKINNEEEIPL